ncbi:MAG: DNA-directed RNA polymerase subunit omega [Candidatus Omnitrophica bacterium]|nr:DNA-directed RNA polymerase subunit omega [Candidatus Omnitrophota bacterium]MCM8791404.1 DNA-directed RNA polymerase subunit omega [Candidatus Omnitrophota bacterium]
MNVDIADLLNKTGSVYKLVILASRRAIELSEGAAKLVDAPPEAKVTNVAIQEIAEGKISYKVKEAK